MTNLYRLKTAAHPTGNPNESFNYDSVGNRTLSHLSSSYTTDELNRLKEDNSFIYGYDADGNLISKKNKATNETTFYYFDAENKLVQVDKYDSTPTLISSVSYAYDGFGRRVKKSVNGVVTFYIYDTEDIRFETDAAGNIIVEYVHGMGIDEPLAMRRNGINYYYHVNGLGSVTALTNASKAVVQSYVYDSFGQIISQTGSITNPYTFTGREYDSETGIYYYRARYYDARIGKFISEDPIGLAGGDVNLYVMVGNNPVNFVDPLGLEKTCTCQANFSAVGPNQAVGIGALGIAPPNDSVAISPASFGLLYGTIAERIATQKAIKNNIGNIRISAPGLSKYLTGGTIFTIGDIGDRNIRNSPTTRFDIYRFATQKDALKFGKHSVPVTITGVPDDWLCPK